MRLPSKSLLISLFMVSFFLDTSLCLAAQTTATSKLLFNLGLQHDSNFYYDADDERGVTTYLVQPGIELGYETAKSEIALHYMLNANYYDESGEDDFYGHTASFMGDFDMSDRLNFSLSDNFVKTRDSANIDDLGNIASRDEYYQNRLRAMLSLDFEPKFTTRFGYQNWITEYDDDNNEDSIGNQGIFDLIYHLNKSTSLDLEYHYWDMDYDEDAFDYTSNQLSLVARKEFRLVDIEAGVGYQNREFDAAGQDDIDVVPYRLNIHGRTASGKSRFSLSAEHNFNFQNTGAEGYYKANRFSSSLDYDFTKKINVGAIGYYQKSDYEDSSREDDTYNISGDINFLIKEWLVFNVTASYETRDSDFSPEEYDNSKVICQLHFSHNIAK